MGFFAVVKLGMRSFEFKSTLSWVFPSIVIKFPYDFKEICCIIRKHSVLIFMQFKFEDLKWQIFWYTLIQVILFNIWVFIIWVSCPIKGLSVSQGFPSSPFVKQCTAGRSVSGMDTVWWCYQASSHLHQNPTSERPLLAVWLSVALLIETSYALPNGKLSSSKSLMSESRINHGHLPLLQDHHWSVVIGVLRWTPP